MSAIPEADPGASPLTLLLLHADYAAVRPLIAMLDARNQRAVPAQTAAEALDQASSFRFDAILAARRLPDMPWQEFMERARVLTSCAGCLDCSSDDSESCDVAVRLQPEEGELDALLASVAATRQSQHTSTDR